MRFGHKSRLLGVSLCVALLAACSPPFDWRQVHFGQEGAQGVLPDKPRSETRDVPLEGHRLPLTMTSARVRSVLFALGAAPLPEGIRAQPQMRARLQQRMVASFYHNVGVAPPAALAGSGERFSIRGEGPDGPVHIEAAVTVTDKELLEAVVIASPKAFQQAPVEDFWLSLHWPGRHRAE